MSAAPPKLSIEVLIREAMPDGSTRIASRWLHDGPKGLSSADNLGREFLAHSDETTGRQALAGWLRSQAERIAPGSREIAPTIEPDEDLIG